MVNIVFEIPSPPIMVNFVNWEILKIANVIIYVSLPYGAISISRKRIGQPSKLHMVILELKQQKRSLIRCPTLDALEPCVTLI